MFQVQVRSTREVVTVFAVHKSGPMDDQTKFLVHQGGSWRWQWAAQFEPVQTERPTLSLRRGQVTTAVA